MHLFIRSAAVAILSFALLPGANRASAQDGATGFATMPPLPWPPVATFSILGFDPATGEVGGAVQSRVFSVGNGVLWAEAGVGVAATQAIVDVSYGPQAITLLRGGMKPADVVKRVWESDPDPRPTDWTKFGRQFAVIDASGNVAAYTGPKASEWAGDRQGKYSTAQGNILAGPDVVSAMVKAFEETKGHLSFRLLVALEAGQAAGGDKRGMQSAAMVIVKKDGGVWLHNDVVLRLQVDDNPEPIRELRRLVERNAAQRRIPVTPRITPAYEVYAVRYGVLPKFRVSSLIAGADTARRLDAAMMVWVIKDPSGRVILVDAGFKRSDLIARWKPDSFRLPSEAIGALGVKPSDVTDVIVSHVHWDHMGGADLFPKAKIWIQRDEIAHHLDSAGTSRDRALDAPDAAMLHALRKAGRVMAVEGDAREIIPGIMVYTGGKHTFQSQYATVKTREGTIVLASDNVYLYENLDKQLPIAQTLDPISNLAAQLRMRTLASDVRLIVPGHDPAVFTRFERVADGVVRIK